MWRKDNVRVLRLHSSDLCLRFGALFQFGHLLTLHRRRNDFLTENDISNLAGGQRCNIDAIALAEVLHVE